MANGKTRNRRTPAGLISSKLAFWGASRQALWRDSKVVPRVSQRGLMRVLVWVRTLALMQVLMQVQVQVQAHWPGPLGWADRGPTERAAGRLGPVVRW